MANTFAACLRTLHHPKLVLGFDCLLVVGPEHARVFAEAGWDRDRLLAELHARLQIPGRELVRGANDMAEGVPDFLADVTLGKFRSDGLLLVHADTSAARGAVQTVIDRYRKAFEQQSVLWETSRVCAAM